MYCICGWERTDKNNDCFLSDSMIAVFKYVCFGLIPIPDHSIPGEGAEVHYEVGGHEGEGCGDLEILHRKETHIIALFYTTRR